MEGILGSLFGGNDNDDDTRRRSRADDFVSRYEKGNPWDDIQGDEAYHNYQAVSGRISPDEYEGAAEDAFRRMPEDQRGQFAQLLQEQMGGVGGGTGTDPRHLAGLTRRYQEQNQSGLASLFGGGDNRSNTGGMLDNPMAKAALGGIAAMAMQKLFSRR